MTAGIETNRRLRCLRPILHEWIALNRRLGRQWSRYNDVPWWYNERASLSVFAGAVWLAGEATFEEYSELKRTRKRLCSGRIALWFSRGQWEFWGEAKFCEIPFTRNAAQVKRINGWMGDAKADVGRCAPDGYTRRLAIVFGAPYLRPCEPPEMNGRVAWLVDQAREVEHDALAWIFPNMKRLPKAHGWISPGTIVWIKEVRRS